MLPFVTEKRPCSPLRPQSAVEVLLSSSSARFLPRGTCGWKGILKIFNMRRRCGGKGVGSGGKVGRVGSGRGRNLQVHNGL